MKELYDNVVHQYASHWEELAAHLGLENHHVDNISKDCENSQNKSVSCWVAALKQWLKAVDSPTWGKLEDVIGSSKLKMYDNSGIKI